MLPRADTLATAAREPTLQPGGRSEYFRWHDTHLRLVTAVAAQVRDEAAQRGCLLQVPWPRVLASEALDDA